MCLYEDKKKGSSIWTLAVESSIEGTLTGLLDTRSLGTGSENALAWMEQSEEGFEKYLQRMYQVY